VREVNNKKGGALMAIVTPVQARVDGRRRLQVSSPADLEPIGEIDLYTREDVHLAVERARTAQRHWSEFSFGHRGEFMMEALKVLLDRQEKVIETIRQETPKPCIDAIQMDIFAACDALHYYAKRTARILATQRKRPHGMLSLTKKLHIIYQPLGVVGIISPWNGPFVLSIVPTIQALMAGNAVVLKPSSVTPFTGRMVGDIFEQAGLPEGVLTVITGDGEAGQALIDAGVDKISFTGSVEVGRKIAIACAERFIPCVLELGGKDPLIIGEDANLDNAAGGTIASAFTNTGQYCCGTERVYVVESVADVFVGKVVERVLKLRQGSNGEFDVGAIYWPQQMEIIERHVADAVSKGAKVLTGGKRNPLLKGLYYEPTVLIDVNHDMQIMREETFGPIIPIMRVEDVDEAIRLANDSSYGLAASVWTRDTRKGFEIARRIQSGSVNINDMTVTYGITEAPFGGMKNSGIGRVNGELGLKGYCSTKPIIIDRFGGKQTAGMYPCSQKKDEGMIKFIRFMWGTPIGRWLSLRSLLP
jgi:acyl-CoA reductase-like NAD-dependent aldehyde dehydrogenase